MAVAGEPIQNVQWIGPGTDTAVVQAVGDIDLHRSADFQRGLMEVLDRGPRQIVVDLSGVAYMDSSGVASLVKLLARVRREKRELRLAGLTARVRSVFEITRLDSVFDIFPNAQEALKS